MMKRWSRFAVPARALALGLVLLAGLAGPAPGAGAAEEKKPQQTVSPEVVKKLKPAQEAGQKGDYDASIGLAKEALAIATKPYDKEMSLRILMFAQGRKKDFEAYADSVQQLLALNVAAPDEVPRFYQQLAQIYAQQKNYERSAEFAAKWAAATNGYDAYTLLWQVQLMQKDCKSAIVSLEKAVEVSGKPGNEDELKRENYCYYQLSDKPKRQAVNEELVYRFLKRDYFIDLLHLYQEQNMDERAVLHMYRFGYDQNFLTRETEYMEFAGSALNVGSPAEAEKIIQKGADSGAVQFTAATDKNSRLQQHAKQQAAEDRKLIAGLDKEARAGKNGEADVKVGLVYLGLGDNAKAIEAIKRGLEPDRVGKVKRVDDAQMMLGIAYARLAKADEAAGKADAVKTDKEGAKAAFTAAQADARMAKVAAIWVSAL
jgi:hypothetical protein